MSKGWEFDQRARRFRGPDGRFVSQATMVRTRDTIVAYHENLAVELTDRWLAGDLRPEQYVLQMRALIKTTTLQEYMLGRGGRLMMTQEDRGRVGGVLTREYRYLNRLVAQYQEGEISAEAARARAPLYIDTARGMYERGRLRAWDVRGVDVPPLHANCFPAGTIVSGPALRGGTARWYEGDLVEVITEGGCHLAATPNHPVLTCEGWVAIGLLHEGNYLFNALGSQGVYATVNPDNAGGEALIEDVLEAFSSTIGMVSSAMPVTPEHFHGDGAGTDIAVVWTNRELRDNLKPSSSKAIGDHALSSVELRDVLARDSSLAPFFEGWSPSTDRAVRIRGERLTFFWGEAGGPNDLSLPGRANRQPSLYQSADNGWTSHSHIASDGQDRVAVMVAADKIVSVNRKAFRGHVYSLETSEGWHNANGIIVHNCKCHSDIEEHGEGEKREVHIYWRTDGDPCQLCLDKAASMNPLVVAAPA